MRRCYLPGRIVVAPIEKYELLKQVHILFVLEQCTV